MQERVILVDRLDREIGTEEKLKAHREGRLHRAFSIFIFNAKGELLLQKRAKKSITPAACGRILAAAIHVLVKVIIARLDDDSMRKWALILN